MANSEIQKVLIKAHALIKRGWTRGVDARDKNGNCVDYNDRRACKFCARGAVRKVTGGEANAVLTTLLLYGIPKSSSSDSVTGFNDTTDKRSVLAAFRRAINHLKKISKQTL